MFVIFSKYINNGAYKAGFASEQEAYEKAYDAFFSAIDKCEYILSDKKFLTGDRFVVVLCLFFSACIVNVSS